MLRHPRQSSTYHLHWTSLRSVFSCHRLSFPCGEWASVFYPWSRPMWQSEALYMAPRKDDRIQYLEPWWNPATGPTVNPWKCRRKKNMQWTCKTVRVHETYHHIWMTDDDTQIEIDRRSQTDFHLIIAELQCIYFVQFDCKRFQLLIYGDHFSIRSNCKQFMTQIQIRKIGYCLAAIAYTSTER